MIILHTADIHLGAKFSMLGEKAQEHRETLKETFSNIIKTALSEKADVLLVAGDLFDSNRVSESTINFAREEFKKLKENSIQACILPGTHDYLGEGAIYLREDFLKGLNNVFIFRDPRVNKKVYSDLDLTVWAKANTSNKSKNHPLELKEAGNKETRYNIAMAHGSVQIPGKAAPDDWPITLEEIASSGMDYIALGHWHGAQDFSQGDVKCHYAGSPEITYQEGKGGLGSGHIIKVEIGEEGTRVEPVKIGKRSFDEITLDLGDFKDPDQFKKELLKGARSDLIRVVNLTGFSNPEILVERDILEKDLEDNFFAFKIRNNTQIRLDDIDEKNYPQELILGQFVRLMKEKIRQAKTEKDKKITEEALQIGLAELEGRRVINI